jgi:Histidine kinase
MQAWVRKIPVIFVGAAVVALLMSTQLLSQPFVWRNWEIDDIMQAWLDLLRDRLIVAMTIATMLATFGQMPRLGPPLVRYILAVFAGAALGEWILLTYGTPEDRSDMVFGRVIQWTVMGGAVAAMLHLWRAEAELTTATQEARIEAARSRRLAATARIGILRQQIEPHFLLNTLATIRRLHETDHQRGQHLLGRLFHYMSATLSGAAETVSTLETEIALVQAYLEVCASRMGGRLTVCCEVPPELQSRPFPPLILATLAENAIKHGIFPQGGGTVWIAARRLPDRLEVELADDGVGFTQEAGSGLGLANIAERLRLLYGPDAMVRLEANAPRGVRASVRIPDHLVVT